MTPWTCLKLNTSYKRLTMSMSGFRVLVKCFASVLRKANIHTFFEFTSLNRKLDVIFEGYISAIDIRPCISRFFTLKTSGKRSKYQNLSKTLVLLNHHNLSSWWTLKLFHFLLIKIFDPSPECYNKVLVDVCKFVIFCWTFIVFILTF